MSWAKHAIERLQAGETVVVRPRGHSMKGKVDDGQAVTLSPVSGPLRKDDIVLVRVKGRDYLHLIKAFDTDRYLIGNNRGGINGWVGRAQIYGIVTKVEP